MDAVCTERCYRLEAVDDVEVGHAGLDHEHVRPLAKRVLPHIEGHAHKADTEADKELRKCSEVASSVTCTVS